MSHMIKEKLFSKSNQWELSLVRASFEILSKFIKTIQKSLDKEILKVVEAIDNYKPQNKDECSLFLLSQAKRVEELREKMKKAIDLEVESIQKLKKRAEFSEIPSQIVAKSSTVSINTWNDTRISLVITDYLLREGFYQTAEDLIKEDQLEDLIDSKTYRSFGKIVSCLKKHQCKEAIKWCGENRSRLKKLHSTLELDLRIQEFFQLVQTNKLEAIKYAKKWLKPGQTKTEHAEKIQKAMGALAFPSLLSSPYKKLCSEERWDELIDHFKTESALLSGLPCISQLCIDFQAGLSILKTENCVKEMNLNCPTCQPPFSKLSQNLPFSRKNNSNLICKITEKRMNDENPPMALPNGYVYSKEGLDQITSRGVVICPRTGFVCDKSELKKIFIT